MKVMLTLAIVLLSGISAMVCAGLIANLYIEWYHISGFEGGSGYFMVYTALLGGLAGVVIGFVAHWIVSSGASPGFLKSLRLSWGIILVLSGLTAWLSWKLADIPPEIDGYLLDLAIEFRLPAEVDVPEKASDDSFMTLQCLSGRKVRKVRKGGLDFASARIENGYRILPASVYLFTDRGKRLIHLVLDGKTEATFITPLPARPRPKYKQWSDWIPYDVLNDPQGQHKTYRFRVQIMEPTPSTEEPLEPLVDAFTTLDPESSLVDWLEYVDYQEVPERASRAMNVIGDRQAELAQLIGSDDNELCEKALAAVARLESIQPEVIKAVLSYSQEIESDIRHFNTMEEGDPDFYDLQVRLRSRYINWHRAWWNVYKRTDVDVRTPVQLIHDLAEVRAGETSMDEIVLNTQAFLNGMEQEGDGEK